MSDVQLFDVLVDGDRIDIAVVQSVSGEDDQTHLSRRLGGGVDLLQLSDPAPSNPPFGEFASVNLDLRRTNLLTLSDLLQIGIDEDRDIDA